MIQSLLAARKTKARADRPTKIDPGINLKQAYDLQYELVERLVKSEGPVIGYKISPKTVADSEDPTRQIPDYGHLLKTMVLRNGAVLRRSDFMDLHLENEVAFVIDRPIPYDAVKTAAELKPYVRSVNPAIELPDIRFTGTINDVTGLDLVVDNVVAAKIILGPGKSIVDINPDQVTVKMTREDEIVNEGISTMVEGSPWNSLLWLVKELGKRGKTLLAGHVVMTGGIANFMDGKAGSYRADFGPLGEIKFKLQ